MADSRTGLLVELCRIMRDYGLDVDNAWTDHGTVAAPGKFEGEPIECLYYHSQALNGMGELIGDFDVLPVDATERSIFGFADDVTHYAVWATDQGFAYGAEKRQAEMDAWRNLEAMIDDGEDV